MCLKTTKFNECHCGSTWDEIISYTTCAEVDTDKLGQCSTGFQLIETRIPAECSVCREERERKEREERERVNGIGGRHVSFDDDIVEIP
jgi:hypothetical protein